MFWRWQWRVLTSVSLRHTEKHTEWNPKYTEVIHRDGVRYLFSNPSELGWRCFQVWDAEWGGSRSETAWWRLWNIFASGVRQRGTTPTHRLAVQRRRSSHTEALDAGGGFWSVEWQIYPRWKFCIVFVVVGHFGPPTESHCQRCSRGWELHLEVEKKTDRAKRQKWNKITSQYRDHLHPTCLYLFFLTPIITVM